LLPTVYLLSLHKVRINQYFFGIQNFSVLYVDCYEEFVCKTDFVVDDVGNKKPACTWSGLWPHRFSLSDQCGIAD
jgi:hypothetical protein